MALLEILPTLLLAVVLSVCLAAARRLYFHPLSGIPGPKVAALTMWWETWVDTTYGKGGQYYFEVKRLHGRYGIVEDAIGCWRKADVDVDRIMRIGPSKVHINDPRWMKVFFGPVGSVR